jgi:hypothetical protein
MHAHGHRESRRISHVASFGAMVHEDTGVIAEEGLGDSKPSSGGENNSWPGPTRIGHLEVRGFWTCEIW